MPRLFFKRLLLWCLALAGLAAAIIGWRVLQQIETEESRWEVVVAVKADGSFYLPSDPSAPVTYERLVELRKTANPQHCVIALEGECHVGAIAPFLNSAAEAGFALYQLRTPADRLNFSVPCCCLHESEPVERWIDLRDEAPSHTIVAPDIPEKVDRSFEPHSEIAVLADLNIPADELIRQCSPYSVSGKSMEIFASDSSLETPDSIPLFLIRHQNEDHAHRYSPPPPGPLAKKVSQWWSTFQNTVNSWF
jgi:hypothetical protein